MTYVADLHTHSPYARATSRELTFGNLARWAKFKGIDLLASADFTHPGWFSETRRQLTELGNGLYEHDGVKFILGTEVNCNGQQGGRNRRIHMLAFAPSVDTVERINTALAAHCKSLASDGRPTLHLTPRELVSTLIDIDERCLIIPAHAWTPWFGIYGSKSGFDSLEECFGDAIEHIHAIETGLSSDPAMNWQVQELDRLSIVSFSDAHSLPKLGRELTVIDGDLSYDGLVQSLKSQSIAYTIEFFPEEGKYHYSGHRKCGISYDPEDVRKNGRRCPVCGRLITLGVMQRVDELSDRRVDTWIDGDGFTRSDNGRPPFKTLVALQQIVAEALGMGVSTKRVQREYSALVGELSTEMAVLMNSPLPDIASVAGERVAEGVDRVRRGDISIQPGYDGLFGQVKVWPESSDGKVVVPTTRQGTLDI